jgi:zinc protease
VNAREVVYPINRDQVVLCFAAHSVSRLDPLFDALLLADQIFAGGVLSGMHSYLYRLREQTGLFYAIGGSLIAHADEQPGISFVKIVVSLDSLAQAEKAICEIIACTADCLTEEELEMARNALINSSFDYCESNGQLAEAFLFFERFNLPYDYFARRMDRLARVNLDQVKSAVRQVLDPQRMITLKIGRFFPDGHKKSRVRTKK